MNLCARWSRLLEAQTLLGAVVQSVNDLSEIYCEHKQPERVVATREEIVPIVECTFGPRHVGMAMSEQISPLIDSPRVIAMVDLFYRVNAEKGCQRKAEETKAKYPELFEGNTPNSIDILPLGP
ncbi:hypothetical protein PGQ11_012095 [Apiospora arundinis]|uniref:Uncharacterized protein n=1 Tax=Apiospora arundinis TaxID=335852 RepID=A0ABR2I1I1_9PEZI